MILLVGLGNYGDQYKNNRHNVGFMVIDSILENFKILESKKKSNYIFYDFELNGEKIILMKPMTFINLSGKPILDLISFYKIPVENVVVFYDDMDMDLGKIRYKIDSGSGGHNGISDIIKKIGNKFNRIKIGIGRPEKSNVNKFVLSDFLEKEKAVINFIFELINKNIFSLIDKNFVEFISKIGNDLKKFNDI